MSNTISKVLNISLYVLLLISMIIVVMFFMKTGEVSAEATFEEQMEILGPMLQTFIGWTYVLFAIAAAIAIVSPIVGIILNPEKAIKSVIPIILVAIVIFVAYSLSSNEIVKFIGWRDFYAEMFPKTEGLENLQLKASTLSGQVGIGLWTMYILLIGSVVSIFVSEIIRIFR